MNSPAEPVEPTLTQGLAVPTQLLQDGEVIILAIKPSFFFVLLMSWPVLALAGVLALTTYLLRETLVGTGAMGTIYFVCAVAAIGRLTIAVGQWIGRLYVLTDRRIMRIRGIFAPVVAELMLTRVRETILSINMGERLLGLGSLSFDVGGHISEAAWLHLARPLDVEAVVLAAIRRAGGKDSAHIET